MGDGADVLAADGPGPADVYIISTTIRGGGFELAKRLKDGGITAPVFIASNEPQLVLQKCLSECNAAGFIPRHLKPEDIVSRITLALNVRAERFSSRLRWDASQTLRSGMASIDLMSKMIETRIPLEYRQLESAVKPIVESIASGGLGDILSELEYYDATTFTHSLRVSVLLALFADRLGMKYKEIMDMVAGGLIQDVGMLFIPSATQLCKRGGDQDDSPIFRSHVLKLIDAIKNIKHVPKIATIMAAQHHERIDGSGYPKALKGDSVSVIARISAIADVFSGLTERQRDEDEIDPERALHVMTNEMTNQLDIGLIKSFRGVLVDSVNLM